MLSEDWRCVSPITILKTDEELLGLACGKEKSVPAIRSRARSVKDVYHLACLCLTQMVQPTPNQAGRVRGVLCSSAITFWGKQVT